MSTAMSQTSPSITRISFACGFLNCICRPRSVFRTDRVIVLNERTLEAGGAVFLGVVRLEKKSALVAIHVRFDDDYARQIRCGESHPHTSCRSIR
jgi:hypothetical protein